MTRCAAAPRRCARNCAVALRCALLAALAISVSGGAFRACLGQELTGYAELTGTRFRSDLRFPEGTTLDSLSRSFLQRYSLTYTQRFLPNLRMQAGGVFERDAARFESDTLELRTTTRTLRPFFNLRLDSRPYLAEVGYTRNEEDTHGPGLPRTGQARETAFATLGWFPEALPSAKMQYFKTNLFDRTRRLENTTIDTLQLFSDYRPVPELYLYYRGAIETTDDRVAENRIDRTSHGGRVIYDDSWWNDRVTLSSDYNVQYREIDTRTSGRGEVIFPISPFAGLSIIDDTPELGALDPNAALIDGNQVAGAGINLGLPPAGGDDRPRNIGLDYGSETEVNTLLVWVDRDLRPEIQSALTWQIYTSADNLNWTLRPGPSSVEFGPFLTRFELHFPNVTTRYIKAVVRPLAPSVPFATDFPVILVTELESSLRRPAAAVRGRSAQTSHTYNLSVRTRLLDEPSLYYELTYFVTKTGPLPKVDTLSNGLYWSQPLGEILLVSGRVTYQTGHERLGTRTALLYTGSLSATPAPTLRASLVYSGTNEDLPGETNDTRSVFAYGTAELYPGIDANLSVGRTSLNPSHGDTTDSTIVNVGSTLVPHRSLTLNLLFQDKSDTIRGSGDPSRVELSTRSAQGDLAYRPLPAIYLFASYRFEKRPNLEDRTINDYSIDWSPFPDGALRFNFSYTETLRSEDDTKETAVTPSARWSFGPRTWLEASFQKLKSDSVIQTIETRIVTATLRTTF